MYGVIHPPYTVSVIGYTLQYNAVFVRAVLIFAGMSRVAYKQDASE